MENNERSHLPADDQDDPRPWPTSNLPRKVHGKQFSKDYQPSGHAKSLGWWKKQRGRKMIKALLEMPFDSMVPINPNHPALGLTENPLRRLAAEYFQVPEAAITVEMIMAMRQIGLAIQKTDTAAFDSVYNKVYGKPQADLPDEAAVPIINIQIGITPDIPEIKETEHEDEQDNSLDSSNSANGSGDISLDD